MQTPLDLATPIADMPAPSGDVNWSTQATYCYSANVYMADDQRSWD